MHTVGLLLLPDCRPFEVGIAIEVWGIDRSDDGVPRTALVTVGLEPGPVPLSHGLAAVAARSLDALAGCDLVLVPGREDSFAPVPEEALAALRAVVAAGVPVASLCSGAVLLARAGVLDGRRATTHWRIADRLAAEHPAVRVDPDALFVGDGAVWTSAGTAAGIDLCLHLVRSAFGAGAAATVARRMVTPPHRDGGQRQYVQTPIPVATAGSPVGAVQEWARRHLDRPLPVAALARRAGMADRTFARRFVAETGRTPAQWLLHERIARSQQLLEAGELGVERVAARCGFASAGVLRTHFRRLVGTTPAAYQRTFTQRREVETAGSRRGNDRLVS
jgi:transcriptional regulator GlxA family with amidase domain